MAYIQDIESVDDYWGPTFRQILENPGSYASSVMELESRAKSHDKDIEKICNLYYQGFIESTKELLQVKTQAKVLNNQILELDKELKTASEGILARGNDLIKARKVEGSVAATIEGLTDCIPVSLKWIIFCLLRPILYYNFFLCDFRF